MRDTDILVVGAGASGLAAAIAAGGSGASVRVLEGRDRIGRSILATGNGRCNFANADLDPRKYNDPDFVAHVMGDEALDDVLAFFRGLGLFYSFDAEGRCYPRSNSAADLLDVLLRATSRSDIEIICSARVSHVVEDGLGWSVACEDGATYRAERLVWAAGGGSAGILGGSLGLDLIEERPVLCPIACNPKPPKSIDGVRVKARVRIQRDHSEMFQEYGEVLWRPYGVSGIVVFDASRYAMPGDTLIIDHLDDILYVDLADELERRYLDIGKKDDLSGMLAGIVHPKMVPWLIDRIKPMFCEELSDYHGAAIAMKRLRFTVRGPADIDHAQVLRGGLANGQWDARTLSHRRLPGLFACGEALDVDGACGGFNLAWAWKSGIAAGSSAATR